MSNSLAAVHPELIAEWSEKNLPLTPDSITFGSNKKVWWKTILCNRMKSMQSRGKMYGGIAGNAVTSGSRLSMLV